MFDHQETIEFKRQKQCLKQTQFEAPQRNPNQEEQFSDKKVNIINGGVHKMHPVFEAFRSSLKPSMFNRFSDNIEEEYQGAIRKSPVKPPQMSKTEKRKERKVKRNLSSIKRKVFNDDSEESQQRSPRKRKMTMQARVEDQQFFSMVIPKLPSIQDEIDSPLRFREPSKQRLEFQEVHSPLKTEKIEINHHNDLLFVLDEEQGDPQLEQKPEEKDLKQELLKNKKESKQSRQQEANQQIMKEEDGKENIFQPTQSMLLKQNEINKYMFDFDQKNNKRQFLYQQVPGETRLIFQGIVHQNQIFNRQYTFWLDDGSKKMMLMKAKKNVKLFEDYYLFYHYNDQQRTYHYLGKLETNFQRQKFTLSNQPQFSEQINKYIYSQIHTFSSINSRPSMVAYFPDFNHDTHLQKLIQLQYNQKLLRTFVRIKEELIQVGSSPELLKTLVRINEEQINYFSSIFLDPGLERTIMKEHKLIRTKKTISFVDKKGKIKLYIGKTESKRYKIFVGSGISPLIAFAIFIVMIQS